MLQKLPHGVLLAPQSDGSVPTSVTAALALSFWCDTMSRKMHMVCLSAVCCCGATFLGDTVRKTPFPSEKQG